MGSVNSRGHRVGLALSGGTLKATAHIGVISALHSLNIYPDCVAGTSAGAVVATLYAHGYQPEDLIELVRQFPGTSLFDYGFPIVSSLFNAVWYKCRQQGTGGTLRIPTGLLRGDKLYRYFKSRLENRDERMPYYITATDLVTGKPVTYTNDEEALRRGNAKAIDDAARCVRGSCSLPGVFTPVKIGDGIVVDGAFRHYVPVEVLRQAGCTKIIAVNLYQLEQQWSPKSVIHVLARAYDILLQESVEADIEGPNLAVLEPDVSHLSWISFREMLSGVAIGRDAVLENADKIYKILNDNPVPRDPKTEGQQIHVRLNPPKHA